LESKSLRPTQATTRSLLISAQYCPEFLVCQEERARTSRFRTPTRHMYVCISIRPAEKTKGISWTATRVLICQQRYSMPGHQRLSQTSGSSQYRIHQASPTRQSPDLFNSAVLLIHPTQTEKRSLPYMKLIVPAAGRERFHGNKPISVFPLSNQHQHFGENKSLRNIKEPPEGGSLARGYVVL